MECYIAASAKYIKAIKLQDRNLDDAFARVMRRAGADADASKISVSELAIAHQDVNNSRDQVFDQAAYDFEDARAEPPTEYIAAYNKLYAARKARHYKGAAEPVTKPLYDQIASVAATKVLSQAMANCTTVYGSFRNVAKWTECIGPAEKQYFAAIKFRDADRVQAYQEVNLSLERKADQGEVSFERANYIYTKLWNQLFAPDPVNTVNPAATGATNRAATAKTYTYTTGNNFGIFGNRLGVSNSSISTLGCPLAGANIFGEPRCH